MIWAEEAECAGHLLAAADRINNKTDGYLDHLLPEVGMIGWLATHSFYMK